MLTSYATVLLGHCHQSNTLYPFCGDFFFFSALPSLHYTSEREHLFVFVCVRAARARGSCARRRESVTCTVIFFFLPFSVRCSAELEVTDCLCKAGSL